MNNDVKKIMNVLNKIKLLMVFMALSTFLIKQTAKAQTYKTSADTVKLNAEHLKLTTEIADLDTQLSDAKNKLPDYESKSNSTSEDAHKAAQVSKEQAATAAGGNLKQISKEKKKAKLANNDAVSARNAENKLKDQNKKIKKLTAEIEKKQKKLSDLDQQKTNIISHNSSSSN